MPEIRNSNIKEKIAWLLRLRKRYRVTGNSMVPTLKAGETVLVNLHAYKDHTPEPDDVVMALHPKLSQAKRFLSVCNLSMNTAVSTSLVTIKQKAPTAVILARSNQKIFWAKFHLGSIRPIIFLKFIRKIGTTHVDSQEKNPPSANN